jgi:hypothetical protein
MNLETNFKKLIRKSYNFKSKIKYPISYKINESGVVEVYDKDDKIIALYSKEMFEDIKDLK